MVDLPRFCAISNRASLMQRRKVVFEVKRRDLSLTTNYMHCAHFVCLFDLLAVGNAYTQFWCSCGLAIRAGHPCRHFFVVLHHCPALVAFHLGLFNPIFILKRFDAPNEIIISSHRNTEHLSLFSLQLPVAIHVAEDDD